MTLASERGWAALLESGVVLFAVSERAWWRQSRGRLPNLSGVVRNVLTFLVGELLPSGIMGFPESPGGRST